eukprot:760659-Hanusia_phi.AAC.3
MSLASTIPASEPRRRGRMISAAAGGAGQSAERVRRSMHVKGRIIRRRTSHSARLVGYARQERRIRGTVLDATGGAGLKLETLR